MTAILMQVEAVRTRASTNEALLTLSVPLEQAALISAFLSRIGQQVGVAFADVGGAPLVPEQNSKWADLPPLTQSAIQLCREPRFQQFVAERDSGSIGEDSAARYMKDWCKVSSRKELESADGARSRFGALMAAYREYLH